MNRKQKRAMKLIQAMNSKDQLTTIQAMSAEGVNFDVAMSSLLDGVAVSSIGGTTTNYRTYSTQVNETYRKYNGESEFGNAQVKTIVDTRSSFIGGEALSVVLGQDSEEGHEALFRKFLDMNQLQSIRLMDLIKQTEMAGYAIGVLVPTGEVQERVPVFGLLNNNDGKTFYNPLLRNKFDSRSVVDFEVKTEEGKVALKLKNFVYFKTGGDGTSCTKLITKVGAVLNECENYDRALKDMRRNNHICARITPDFETKNATETKGVTDWLNDNSWKIGDARVGTAKFSYKTPGTGAHQNLEKEMVVNLKTMSGETAVPPHWFGWVDQMSNRATAKELYNSVNNGTIMERNIITAGIKQALIEMQLVYINSGGDLIKEATTDFEVSLPLMDFDRFKSNIEAYSLLYADEVVSLATYRNQVPGIDPLFEARQIEKEKGEKPIVTKTNIDIALEDEESLEGEEQ
jgi:NADH:ubiquinone oxidoreductase subunit